MDIVMLAIFPILATLVSLLFKASYFLSVLLFFGAPSVYFSIRTPKQVLRASLFSLLFVPLVGMIINYFAIIDGSWYVPHSLFPRLFGMFPLEDLFLSFFYVYSIIISYEHFWDKSNHTIFEQRFIRFFLIPILCCAIIFFSLFHIGIAMHIPYFYLWLGIFTVVLPTTIALSLSILDCFQNTSKPACIFCLCRGYSNM